MELVNLDNLATSEYCQNLGACCLFKFPAVKFASPLVALSLRAAGDMQFKKDYQSPNRAEFFSQLGLDASNVLGTELTHSKNILYTSKHQAGLYDYDGIILHGEEKLAACITVADCLPIWIYDEQRKVGGVLHSGWKGTGILHAAIDLLLSQGSKATNITAIIGPGIGACCYAIPADRYEIFKSEFGDAAVLTRDAEFFLDLRAANITIAQQAGIARLLNINVCTQCGDEQLGSYRRQGKTEFTRMAAIYARNF